MPVASLLSSPTGDGARAGMEGMMMKKIDVKVTEANRSFAAYIRAQGFEISDEQVALTGMFHREWQSSDARVSEREAAKIARQEAANAAKVAREAERTERLLAERAKLEAKLAKLASVPVETPDVE